jgi:hypothetical protein
MTASDSSPRMRLAVIAAAAASVVAGPAIAYVSVDERELGRTDPRRAAFYSGLWADFNATYRDGSALGISVGMPKDKALDAAAKQGFALDTVTWDDPFTDLPDKPRTPEEIRAQALAVDYPLLYLRRDDGTNVELTIDDGRVSAISVQHYGGPYQ